MSYFCYWAIGLSCLELEAVVWSEADDCGCVANAVENGKLSFEFRQKLWTEAAASCTDCAFPFPPSSWEPR